MDLFLGLGILALVLAVLVSPALGGLLQEGHVLAAAVAVVTAGLIPVINLYRYRRAPGGCLALALGFAGYTVAFAAGLDLLMCVAALAAPNVAFALGEPLWRRVRDARALAQVDAAADAVALAGWLGDPATTVREHAAKRLAARPPTEALAALDAPLRAPSPAPQLAWSTVDQLPPSPELESWLTARLDDDALAPAAAQRLATKHPDAATGRDDPRPAVRAGLGVGLLAAGDAHVPRACALLVGVLADPQVDPDLRQEALDALEPAGESPALTTAAAVTTAEPTTELLWLWAEHGQAAQAVSAAALVADGDYGRANAALEAVHGILQRVDGLGEHRAAVEDHVRAGVEAIRAVHPPGDNLLADGLVDDLESLRAALATPPPASAGAAG